MEDNEKFTFNISLSVLNHLGRNLYRNFVTVLGEAISNSWDACAKNVWIYIDKNTDGLVIKDDGEGMTSNDFQDKFLLIGYTKRQVGKITRNSSPICKRPYIGRKGIGKLALLSCAEKVMVVTKTENGEYVGGTIDNSGLTDAITDNLKPQEYPLEKFDLDLVKRYTVDHKKGTIIYFDKINDGIKNTSEHLRKVIALYFRFSLIDDSFKIFLNDEEISLDDLKVLAEKTQFLWNINTFKDEYIDEKLKNLKESKIISMDEKVSGFIASVMLPKDLKIFGSEGEKVGVDLFVNGRLRERDILKHIPTARVVESYLYGQIHFNELDEDKIDRFATAREGIVANDEKYSTFLKDMEKTIAKILDDWDDWRVKHRQDGDLENQRRTEKERKSRGLFNAVSKDYEDKNDDDKKEKSTVDKWVDELANDAQFNFTSYAECFIAENLIRKHIEKNKINLSGEAVKEINKYKDKEKNNKNKGNISIPLRKSPDDTSYLSMDGLANLVDKRDPIKEACLSRDANEYKPIRDAVMHTARLTDQAKKKLETTRENIKSRVKTIVKGEK
ncbi:MAG: ATP-binding protein [Candidatus Diapherotrites archaeon]